MNVGHTVPALVTSSAEADVNILLNSTGLVDIHDNYKTYYKPTCRQKFTTALSTVATIIKLFRYFVHCSDVSSLQKYNFGIIFKCRDVTS